MKSMRRPVLTLLCSTFLFTVSSHAATKPEQAYVQQNSGPQTSVCGDPTCTVGFAAVPAGYRLEVSYVSAEFVMESGPPEVLIDNGATGTSHATLTLPTPNILNVFGPFANCILSVPVTFYVEAGNKPTIILSSSGNLDIAGEGPFRVTIVGKLVPLDSGAKDVE